MDEWVVGRAVVGMGLGVCVCGKAARRTFPAIVQVLFEISGDVRRAAPQAGRGKGCALDVPLDFLGFL